MTKMENKEFWNWADEMCLKRHKFQPGDKLKLATDGWQDFGSGGYTVICRYTGNPVFGDTEVVKDFRGFSSDVFQEVTLNQGDAIGIYRYDCISHSGVRRLSGNVYYA